jgi:hypothetical protein
MKQIILTIALVCSATIAAIPVSASLADDIRAIKDKIDAIDLTQSKNDIQSDLDDVQSDLDALTEPEHPYVPQPTGKSKPNFVLGPATKVVNGHTYKWIESDNPQIGWHWVQVN